MIKIREKNPEGKNPFLELLGLNDVVGRGDENLMDMLDNVGCTANVLLITDGTYYCANAGDSRCVLSQRGRAIEMSEDHKPENKLEYERIINAGCDVIEGRVDGNLNLSRSLGDLKHKQVKELPVHEQPIT
jgi:serine/threonine protein phosphatase PrpC